MSISLLRSNAGHREYDEPPLSRTYVIEATDYGLQKMNELFDIQEPRLYQIGMWLEKDNPARYVAAFNSQSQEAKRLAKFGYASLQATSKLVQQLYSDAESRATVERIKFPTVSLLHTALHDQCPLRSDQVPRCPDSSGRYRTPDGRCNNPGHPWWGASMMPLHRFLPPHYRDGLEKMRMSVSGGPLPSARAVSTSIHSDRDNDLTSITHMVMQWGQFLDHDLTSSAQTRGYNGTVPKCCAEGGHDFQPSDLTHPDCMPIPVPPDDWFYSNYGIRCLEFVRSMPTSRVGCSLGPRDQINQVTSFIDGSAIYGSSDHEEDDLRMFRNGLLKYSRVQYRLPLLPAANYKADLCRGQSGYIKCFHAGDKRVNEQPGLIALHTIWMRAHNKIATELSHINPHWRDEKLYQETRRIVGAMMQHITFKEFLPIVLGQDVVKLFDLQLMRKGYFNGYDIKTNPTAANAFGTAAFRFGHSLVQHSLVRCDRSHKRLRSNVSLHEELTNPSNLYNIGSVDRLLLGLCSQPAQKRDEFITEELTNRLFQTPNYRYGMDLAALNIQRGRDHGLAPYNAWREPCGLEPLTDWKDLLKVMSLETQRRLKRVYRDVDDIDLFPGAMAERPVTGGLVGPTFACILAQQFSNLRKGDRFWYENGGFESSFTLAQLQQIRRTTLARILCDNLDGVDTLQPFVFLAVDDDRNHRVPCGSSYIPQLDLKPWTEHHKDDVYENPVDHEQSPTHQKPSYPTYQRPPTKPTPSYHQPTTPSYSEHKPSYLIDFGSQSSNKPYEENKPSYLIDSFGKPSRPQNMYTTSKYPKPHEEHKPSYLIDEAFQQENTKRPFGGHRPTDSAFLPLEHKEPNHDHGHNYQQPSKPQSKPTADYQHHHESGYELVVSSSHTKPINAHPSYSKPNEDHHSHHKPHEEPHKPHPEYSPNHHKPLDKYPSQPKPHEEYPSIQKPHEEYPPIQHKPHVDYPAQHKPHEEYPAQHKPHEEYPAQHKPHEEYPVQHKPHEEYPEQHKPHEEYPLHHKPHEEYPLHHKPHEEYPSHHKPHEEYPSHHKPHEEYPFHHKPHEEYPSHHNPHEEYPSHHNPHEEYPSHHNPHEEYPSHLKPHEEYPSHHKPHEEYPSHLKPQEEYPSHHEPHGEYPSHQRPHEEHPSHNEDYSSSHHKPKPQPSYSTKPPYSHTSIKPNYGHIMTTKPYHEHPTEHYEPQYLITFTIPLTSSKPNYGHTSYTKPYEKVPSTLDYEKFKPRPSKPTNPYNGGYSGTTKPPHKEHYAGSYSSLQRPTSHQQQQSAYSYIKLFNEPSYYYLEELSRVRNKSQPGVILNSEPGLPEDSKGAMTLSDTGTLEVEPRASVHSAEDDDSTHDLIETSFGATGRAASNDTKDIVTIEGNIVNINIVPNDSKKLTVTSTKINVSVDAGLHNSTDKNAYSHGHTDSEETTTNNFDSTIADRNNPGMTDMTSDLSNSIVQTENSDSNSTEWNNIESTRPTGRTDEFEKNTEVTEIINTLSTIISFNSVGEKDDLNHKNSITNPPSIVTIMDNLESNEENYLLNENLNTTEKYTTLEETVSTTDITNHRETTLRLEESSSFTTEQYTVSDDNVASTVGKPDYEDDWIYMDEEDVSFLPEMPTIAGDPMALKELPRPMVFEEEESSRSLV